MINKQAVFAIKENNNYDHDHKSLIQDFDIKMVIMIILHELTKNSRVFDLFRTFECI